MIFYIVVFLFSVFVSSVSQIILKKSAQIEYENKLREYLNVRVITAYGMFFLSTLLTMYAYKGVPLSMGVLLESVGYLYIMVLSYFFLGEKVTVYKTIGVVFILLGICCYALF